MSVAGCHRAAYNGILDRGSFVLRELAVKAVKLEEDYANHRRYPEERLNYQFGFPEVVDSFVLKEQGGRRINILAFPCLEARSPILNVSTLVPLHNILHKDNKRVDLRTSAWIMGKILKLLAFVHDHGVELGGMDLTTILIQPDEHFVILFDWERARTHPEVVPLDQTRQEIMDAAKTVIILLGGDRATRTFPEDVSTVEGFEPYTQYLLSLAAGSQANALIAHGEFYQLLKRMGWRGFHPFTITNR